MRIVYIGVVDFSYHCLEIVLQNKGNVVGVVTTQNSKKNSDYKDLTPLAQKYNIPVHYFNKINDRETVEWIREKKPDIIFAWGLSELLKPDLLSIPPMGVIGVHPALLPKNRGRHPLIWALVLGLKESGLTFFFLDEGADSGPILSQKKFEINDEDDASTLYEKIKLLAKEQIEEFLPQLISGSYKTFEQDHTKANYWRKRTYKDGIIDWRMSEKAILNLVRALTKPYPGAETVYKGVPIKIWKAERYIGSVVQNLEPGKILTLANGFPVIKCYDGAIVLKNYEPEITFDKGDYLG